MGYVKNTWVDQDVERPKTYEVTTNQDGSITLTDSFGLVTELGTPVNATNMNHIENGLALSDLMQYSATVTYSTDEWVTGVVNNEKGIYASLVDNNVGNALSDDTKWEEVQLGNSLPDQTGHSGDLLTTDGTDASWVDTDEVYPIVETYRNGASWYRVYSDGWCEQGGIISIPDTNTVTTITLLKPFVNTNYSVVSTANPSSIQWSNMVNCQITAKTVSSFGITDNVPNNSANWRACGYIS